MKKYFCFVFKETCRNKNNHYLILILSICFFLIFLGFEIISNFTYYIEHVTNSNLDFRTVILSQVSNAEDIINKLEKTPHVSYVGSSLYMESGFQSNSFQEEKLDGTVYARLGTKRTIPPIVYGKTFKDTDKNVAICPINFYPDIKSNSKNEMNEEDFLTKEKTLNRKIIGNYFSYKIENNAIVKHEEHQKEFTIVGLYDSSANGLQHNECFLSYSDIKEINDRANEYNKNIKGSLFLIVDAYKNVDEVKENLSKMNYSVTSKAILDLKFINTMKLCLKSIIAISLSASFALIVLNVYKKVIGNSNQIAIRLCFGYRKKDISKLETISCISVVVISICISFILFLVSFFLLSFLIFQNIYLSGFKIVLHPFFLIFTILISILFTMLISRILIYKLIMKKEILDLLKTE